MLLPDITQSPSFPTWLQAARNTPSRHQKGVKGEVGNL